MKKVILVWTSIFLSGYLVLEIFFFHYVASIFPYSSLGVSGPGGVIFSQYTKSGVVPKNYIGILGDSYAYGQGDWLLSTEHSIKPVFSATQLIHQKINRDVISFGFPAADSIRVNNVLPTALLAYARNSTNAHLDDPSTIIVYFYEGNDLDDNVEVAQKRIFSQLPAPDKIFDSAYFQGTVIPGILEQDDLVKASQRVTFLDKLFFLQFAKNLTIDFYKKNILGQKLAPWKVTDEGKTAKARIGGEIRALPDRLQAPSLTLTPDEIKLGLYMFEQSLIYLRKEFPNSRVGIAYIPAVVTSYEIVSPQINDYYKDRHGEKGRLQNSDRIRSNSDAICNQVRTIGEKQGVGFIDTRAQLRAAAKNTFIHGPIDWHHFNQLGYEVFTEDLLLLIDQVENGKQVSLPECRWE